MHSRTSKKTNQPAKKHETSINYRTIFALHIVQNHAICLKLEDSIVILTHQRVTSFINDRLRFSKEV